MESTEKEEMANGEPAQPMPPAATGFLMLIPIYGIGFIASLILTGHWKP
jgi:hypothetical protein